MLDTLKRRIAVIFVFLLKFSTNLFSKICIKYFSLGDNLFVSIRQGTQVSEYPKRANMPTPYNN